jgi:hypothetical protein
LRVRSRRSKIERVFTLIWLAGPAAIAALLTLVTRVRSGRVYVMFVVGVAFAMAFVLVVYLRAPPDYLHSQGDDDGEMFLGRWWEPEWVAILAFVGYVFWALGVAGALLIRGAFNLVRDRG